VQKRILPIAITAITFISLFGWNCTKLDTTDIGGDLLPAVDNVNTFDTILTINSTQQSFYSDSTYIGKYDDHALGAINNDPLFGSTKASIYMQLKPPYYPFNFAKPGDTLNGSGAGIDSVVLCLKYKGFWGDSTMPVQIEVREVNDFQFGIDSVFKDNPTSYQPNTGALLGSKSIDVRTLGTYIKYNNGRDSVNNQIRIKLSAAWAAQLYNRDSLAGNAANNAFYNDSIYRRFYNGIAVIANGAGNGLMYASLSDTATKLEIHYRVKNSLKVDSVYTSFTLNSSYSPTTTNAPVSNTANHIIRNRSGAVLNPPAGEHYLQTAPGTFINLHIPGLAGLSNRIIHRAEIIVEQLPPLDALADKFTAPNFLYLDLKDTGTTVKWKPIYYDLNTSQTYDPDYRTTVYYLPVDQNTGGTSIDFLYFGGYKRNKPDISANQINHYSFNISRYVQQIVTDHTPVYDMRLYAPFNITYPQYSISHIPYGNNIAFGRIRIGSGSRIISGSNTNYALRLRIVYSKL
jgi:Domain of unknown function (DUF4270)